MQLLTIVAIGFAILASTFALQNNVPVTVSFIAWSFESSLAVVLLLALAMGALILALVSTPSVLRDRWTLNRQRRRIADLEQTCQKQSIEMAELAAQLPEDSTPPGTSTQEILDTNP